MDPVEKTELLESAKALVAALESDDDEAIQGQLTLITQKKDDSLFNNIGKLTRELHAAISNLDVDSNMSNLTEVDFPDSREKLDYVVKLTHDSAHKTLETIDTLSPKLSHLKQTSDDLAKQWQAHFESENSLTQTDPLHQQLVLHFEQVTEQMELAQSCLSDITLAQSFQDLTGQVIQKVAKLIDQVQSNLVELITVAAKYQPKQAQEDKKVTSSIEAQGPQTGKSGSINNQDDVDDLLSHLGF